jgi:hypothetical protein
VKWLSQGSWQGYPAKTGAPTDGAMDLEEAVRQFAKFQVWSRYAGPEPGMTNSRATPVLLARHGLLPDGRRMPKILAAENVIFHSSVKSTVG